MDEMYQFQNEMEQRLELALSDMENGIDLTQDDINVIRAACGKPRNSHVHPILRDVINDFGNIFGGAK